MKWKRIGATFEHAARAGWAHLSARFTRKSIGVALANQPRLLRDMLRRQIEREPDFRVVTVTGDPAKWWQTFNRARVDWVVMTSADPLSDLTLPPARSGNRQPAFVALSRDAHSAAVTILTADGQSQRQVFPNLTLDQLFAILRRPAGQDV